MHAATLLSTNASWPAAFALHFPASHVTHVGVQGLGGEVAVHWPNEAGGMLTGAQSSTLATPLSSSCSVRGAGIVSAPGFVPNEHFSVAPSTTNFFTINVTAKHIRINSGARQGCFTYRVAAEANVPTPKRARCCFCFSCA